MYIGNGQTKLSVIIFYCNDSQYLDGIKANISRLVDSGMIFEVLVWDDGSSLTQANALTAACGNLKCTITRSSENKGLCASRLESLRMASGDYIWFVDADDEILEVPVVDAAYDLYVYDFLGTVVGSPISKYEKGMDKAYLREIVADKSSCVLWNKIIKRKFLELIPYESFRNGDDIYINLSLLKLAPTLKYVQRPIINYIVRQNSLSRKYCAGRLLELSRVISKLRSNKVLNRGDAFQLWSNYIFRNFVRSVVRNKNPLFSELSELIQGLKCLI